MLRMLWSKTSNDVDMIWMIFTKILKKYNSNKKRKILLVFDLIAEILSHKKLNVIETELFIRENNLI